MTKLSWKELQMMIILVFTNVCLDSIICMYSFFPYCVTVCLGTLFSWSQTLPTITKQGYKLCPDLPLTLRSVLCQIVKPVTIFTCTHCNLYDLYAHWDHNHLGIKSEVFSWILTILSWMTSYYLSRPFGKFHPTFDWNGWYVNGS